MIATENQLRVSKDRLAKFVSSYRKLDGDKSGYDPIGNAQLSAIDEQINRLRDEIQEYEKLRAGAVTSFEVQTLLDLPRALIKARISRSLTQTALAELLGVKPQQVQRWEAEEYRKVGLDRLAHVARILGLRIADRIELIGDMPVTVAQIRSGLMSSGLSKDIIEARLIPSKLNRDDAEFIDEIDARMNFVFGAGASDVAFKPMQLANSSLAFKLPKSASQEKTRAYAQYVRSLCRIAVKTTDRSATSLPATWQEISDHFFKSGVDLETALNICWDHGVPVLGLDDSIAFHGACWAEEGRFAIVLKQNHRDLSRWLFDLLHEIYHVVSLPAGVDTFIFEEEETSDERRGSVDEKRAQRFAAEVITNGRLEELTTQIFEKADGQGPRLKQATIDVSATSGVPVGVLANLMAHRLMESGFDWWAVAARLQRNTDDPVRIVRSVFLKRAKRENISRFECDFLMQAMEY